MTSGWDNLVSRQGKFYFPAVGIMAFSNICGLNVKVNAATSFILKTHSAP